MNKEKVLGMIGLARRAGKVSCGGFLVSRAISSGEAEMLFIANDASDNTKSKFINNCEYYSIDYNLDFSADELTRCVGKENSVVLSINDASFVKGINKAINS